MAGSKKGERRGGAKPGHIRKSVAPPSPMAAQVKRGRGRPPGAKNKPKDDPASKHKPRYDPALVKILNKRIPPERKEQEIEMYFTITGKRQRMPKEVMLDAMRYFEESAIEYSKVLEANLQRAAAAETPEEQALLGDAVSQAEAQVDKYLSMAVDVAFKAGPFLHPRLAAVLTSEGADKSNQSLFAMLMKDLDEAGKPPRYIEHDPNERRE